MKVMLLNDTATVPHVGCQAVSDAHARMLGGAGHTVVDRYFLGELRKFASNDEYLAIGRVLSDANMRERLERFEILDSDKESVYFPLLHGFTPTCGAARSLPGQPQAVSSPRGTTASIWPRWQASLS